MNDNGLNEEGKAAMTLLDKSADERTVEARAAGWIANAVANRRHFREGNPPLAGLAVFVVAAGPSLKKNIAALRTVSRRGIIVCVEAAFRYLLENGVTPEYCLTIDGDDRMLTMIDGADTSRTTLVAMASACPALVDAWRGPRFFLRCLGGRVDIDDKLIAVSREVVALRDIKAGEVLQPLDDLRVDFKGLGVRVSTGGNVTGAAHSFAVEHLRAARVIFVGADYSWTNPDEFYAGGEHGVLAAERQEKEKVLSLPSLDGEVATNFSMFRYKDWHEQYAAATQIQVINASEGGILGVTRDGKPAIGWEHMTLADAIARFAPERYATEPAAAMAVPA